jgi:hypothetical protein
MYRSRVLAVITCVLLWAAAAQAATIVIDNYRYGAGGGGGGSTITGISYTSVNDYGYTGCADETKMRDGLYGASDTVCAGTGTGGYILADFGSTKSVTKINLATGGASHIRTLRTLSARSTGQTGR